MFHHKESSSNRYGDHYAQIIILGGIYRQLSHISRFCGQIVIVHEKLMDISKKQGKELVIPPKEKLDELSRVMNNEKLVDVIRNKEFSEFTEKEIKDVDVVRGRFNSFVNEYY